MSDGLWALIGVAVGALATGGRDWLLGWLGDRRAARMAGRLVLEELLVNVSILDRVLEDGRWPISQRQAIMVKRQAWDAHQRVLAQPRSTTPWAELSLAYVGINAFSALAEGHLGQSLTAERRSDVERIKRAVDRGIARLGHATGLEVQ